MPDIKEEAIRARAYELWEAGGQVHGNHDAHWDEAVRQLTAEAAAPAAKKKPASAKKPAAAKPVKTPTVKAAAASVENDTKTASVAKKRAKAV